MNFLEQKIQQHGKVLEGNILKVDGFLNHQIDIDLMRQIACEFKRRFADVEITKILTIEASGIAIASLVGNLCDVPVVYAKKRVSLNTTSDKYIAEAFSYTHRQTF